MVGNSFKLGYSLIQLANFAYHFDDVFNSKMSVTEYVSGIYTSSYMHIRNLYRIRLHVPMSACISLANALVSIHIGYCNSLVTGIT